LCLKNKSPIKTYRKKQGLTQADLANRAELHIRQIQKIENGEEKTANITLKTMQAIAQALNVKIDDLIS
jgi:transcriptional regulator with XRE-family HTH domain